MPSNGLADDLMVAVAVGDDGVVYGTSDSAGILRSTGEVTITYDNVPADSVAIEGYLISRRADGTIVSNTARRLRPGRV